MDSRRMNAMNYLWVGLGSGLGGMARHWMATAVLGKLGGSFPWGTCIVNVAGCFLVGLAAALAFRGGLFTSATAQAFFLTGFWAVSQPFPPSDYKRGNSFDKGKTAWDCSMFWGRFRPVSLPFGWGQRPGIRPQNKPQICESVVNGKTFRSAKIFLFI